MPPRPSARERIRQSALELLARKGVAGTTTQDVARRAQCSQAAIYKYWNGKEALARAIFEDANRGLIDAMRAKAESFPTPSERALGALLGLMDFAHHEPNEFAYLFHVFHSEHVLWTASHPIPRDVVLRELETAAERGEISPAGLEVKTALLLGMAIRLAFFERQKLIHEEPAAAERIFWSAAAAVLES
jgi:AcrR family transcriptional regulator